MRLEGNALTRAAIAIEVSVFADLGLDAAVGVRERLTAAEAFRPAAVGDECDVLMSLM